MAKARPTRTTTVRKRRIVITKPAEDKGDLQISAHEAKIRLTPKLFLALSLVIAASISIYLLVSHYPARFRHAAAPVSPAETQPTRAQSASGVPNSPPRMTSAAIVPSSPSAESPLDIAYQAVDTDGNPINYTFGWYVNDAEVQEGPSSALQPGPYHAGDVVYAEVTPADASSTGMSMKTNPVTIAASPLTVGGIMLNPEKASIGDGLTATMKGDAEKQDSVSYQYQWYVNGEPTGAPGGENTFDTSSLKKRDSVSVAVSASLGDVKSGTMRSNAVILQNRPPEILSSAPESLDGSGYSYQVVAKDPDGDALTYRLERAPAGMTINAKSGLIQWTLPKNTMFAGRNEAQVRVTADDGDGGTASQDFTIVFTDLYAQ